MKAAKVFDSWALLAYFEGQEGGRKVMEIFKEVTHKQKDLFLNVVNWGEILYIIQSRYGKEKRDEIEHLMSQMHLKIIDVDQELAREAAHLKATRRLPYADCFAAALAKLEGAVLVTGDRDFETVEGEIKIEWL